MLDTEMTTGEVQTPDAGENKEKKSFDELIEGDYRREYGEKVEAIVKNRLKNHAETKEKLTELTDMLTELGKELGVESNDPREIIACAKGKGKEEITEATEACSDTTDEGDSSPMLDPTVISRVKELAGRVAQTKEYYPDFDITKELLDPTFAMLLRISQGDPRRAYEMKYHDRILTNAMQYAVTETENRLANSIAGRTARPAENAASGSSAIIINSDPSSLTKAQRSEIKKRVRRGERILW